MSTNLTAHSPIGLDKLAEINAHSTSEVEQICLTAQAASKQWQQLSIKERATLLEKFRKKLFASRDEIAQLITQEIGKPILQSYMAELYPSLANLKYLIKNSESMLESRNEETPFITKATLAKVTFLPYGVIGIIGTWNYPLLLNLSTIIEALIAGNSVVFKPSELSWMVAQKIQQLFDQAELPKGIFQTVYGGAETGQSLIKSQINKLFFTGSVEVGRQVQTQCAEQGKPAVLELSGNDPFIVRHDAPLSIAAAAAVWGSMLNSGQNCIGTKRILVHQSIYTSFKEKMIAELKKLKMGPGQDWSTTIGPLRREKELIRCEELIQEATQKGAHILLGGKRAQTSYAGHFFEPTLIENINNDMRLWNEDYFGPIALLDSFETDEEAIKKANSNSFGLGGAIFSKDQKRAEQMALQLESGMVTINEVIWPISLPMLPFGGTKASGFGRTRGLEGLREMVYTKTLFARSAKDGFRPHYFQPASKWTSKIPKWMGWFYR